MKLVAVNCLILTLTGWVVMSGSVLTVRSALLDVAAGLALPLTTTR